MLTALFIACVALAALDSLSTWYALHKGIGQEANPVVKGIFSLFGQNPGLIILFVFKAFVMTYLYVSGLIWFLAAFVAIYGLVVANNIYVIKTS